MRKYISILVLLFGVLWGGFVKGATFTSNGTDLVFGDPNTWIITNGTDDDGIPDADDDVIIANGHSVSVELDSVYTIRSLTIGTSDLLINTTLRIRNRATLNILEDCFIYSGGSEVVDEEDEDAEGDPTQYMKRIFVGSNTNANANTKLIIGGDLTIAARSDLDPNNTCTGIELMGYSQLQLVGSMYLIDNRGFLNAPATATVFLKGTSPQQIYMGTPTDIKFPNLIIEGDSVYVFASEGSGNVSGNLKINQGAFDNSGKTIVVLKDIIIEDSARFYLTGASTISVTTATSLSIYGKLITEHRGGLGGFQYPGSIILGDHAEIEFAGNDTEQVTGFGSFISTHVFSKLTFSNKFGTTLNRSVGVKDLVIPDEGILYGGFGNGSPNEIRVTNGWFNYGEFIGNTSTVRFETGSSLTLQGEGSNKFNHLIVDGGTTLSASDLLTITGNLIVNPGSYFKHNDGRVVFKPTVGGVTSGVRQFYHVTVDGGVQFAGNDTINGELYMKSGLSLIPGSLALNLNSGYVNPEGVGTFSLSDSITFFKKVNHKGYSYLSFPIATTVDNLKTSGFNHVFSYDETRDPLYVEYKTMSTALPVDGRGYPSFANYTEPVIRLKGAYDFSRNNVSVGLSSTLVNGEVLSSRTGWNLIGNPYAFNLDWDILRDGQDIYGSVYFYNGVSYSYYVGGVPASGNIIAPMQAFMVYLPNSTGVNKTSSFNLSKNAGLPGTSQLFRKVKPDNVLKLYVEGNGTSDATYIRLSDETTIDFDPSYDAFKFKNTGNAPSFYSMLNGENYSINSIPATFSTYSVSLAFEPKVAGHYTITLSEEYPYDLPYEIYLEDKVLNILHPIGSENTYTFATNLNESVKRFILHFGSPIITGMNAGLNNFVRVFAENRDITIYGMDVDAPAEIKLYDLAGRMVTGYSKIDLKNKSFTMKSVNTQGVYILNVVAGEKSYSERVVVY